MNTDRLKKNLRLISGRSKHSKHSSPARSSLPDDADHNSNENSSSKPNPLDRPGMQSRMKSVKNPSFAQLMSSRGYQIDEKALKEPSIHEPDVQETPMAEELKGEELQSPVPERVPESPSAEASEDDFQLTAPTPNTSVRTLEGLTELLFSPEHLQFIIQDPFLFTRFIQFLKRFRPNSVPVLLHHLEIQKATKALEYANAVAGGLGPFPGDQSAEGLEAAAAINKDLEERRQRVIDILMAEALPAQVTYSLVQVVSDAMQKAIRGLQQTPIMRNLIGGLTEVFVLTDPSLEDNPIIYASEEFYRMTGYGRDFVIGRNCRFLQGPKTVKQTIRRLKSSIDDGLETSEAILNYRRDGTPFMNLLMVAPLHDKKGNVKYQIGAQVDVTGLVEQGQGLEGFDSFLSHKQRAEAVANRGGSQSEEPNLALEKLAELSQMFDVAESAVVRSNSRSNSMTRDSGYDSTSQPKSGGNRRILLGESDSDDESDEERGTEDKDQVGSDWKLARPSAATGKLPGVYQKYLLVRPAPSLRVIFVSPALRELEYLLRAPFLDCVTSSKGTLHGLKDALNTGAPVSGRVRWRDPKDAAADKRRSKGQAYWISATPMLGSDDSIGVWMMVVVEHKGGRASRQASVRSSSRPVRNHDTGSSALPAGEATEDAEAKSAPTSEQSETHVDKSEADPENQDNTEGQATAGEVEDQHEQVQQAVSSNDETEIPERRSIEASPQTAMPTDHVEVTDSADKPTSHDSRPEPDDVKTKPESQEYIQQHEEGRELEGIPGHKRLDEDSDNDSDDGNQYLPVSKHVWTKPPRPGLPPRMISID